MALPPYAPMWPPDPKPIEAKPIPYDSWPVFLGMVKLQIQNAQEYLDFPVRITFKSPLEDDMETRLIEYFKEDRYVFYVLVKDWEVEYWVRDRRAEDMPVVLPPPKATYGDMLFAFTWRALVLVSLPFLLTKIFG